MKKIYFLLMLVVITFLFNSCKKDDDTAETLHYKKDWVTGKWKQTDLVMSVDAKLGSTKIPAGTSMIAIAPLLAQALKNPALIPAITCTNDNQYEFNAQGAFTITGCTDFILPKAGNKGTWGLQIYDAVIELLNDKSEKDPHWINSITPTKMELALTVNIPGVGAVPLGLQLEKLP